jgi:hypothetical protein
MLTSGTQQIIEWRKSKVVEKTGAVSMPVNGMGDGW